MVMLEINFCRPTSNPFTGLGRQGFCSQGGQTGRKRKQADMYSIWLLITVSCVTLNKQSDAKPCVVLIRKTHKFISEIVGSFLTTMQMQGRNTGEHKDRI